MEPNWQPTQPQPGQGGAKRPSLWQDGGNEGRVQKPLGTGGAYSRPGSYPPPTQGRPAREPYPSGRYQTGPSYPPPGPAGQAWHPGQPMNATGPVPDPFEEPANAPELRSARSDNLYKREGRFWESIDGRKTSAGGMSPTGSVRPASRTFGHTLMWIVLILLVLAGVCVLLYSTVFRVREISVQGGRTIPDAEIIRLSGITMGTNLITISDAQVEKKIESNRYLSFVCVDKQLPDRVVIQVRERVPAAYVKHCGILYVIDNRGMVLEESLDAQARFPNLVSVEGLDIKYCRVGEPMVLNSSDQLKIYVQMMMELKAISQLSKVEELDLSNMDNIFLVSRDGYAVRLGKSEMLHEKLFAMRLAIEKLDAEGYLNKGGTLDVSKQDTPTYIPQGDWLQPV